jgi:hypothetical protein
VAFRHEGVVRVFCNIHPTMSAVIVVLKYPWFAVSDAAGAFTVPGAPPGEYQLHVFHERATQETLDALERRITVGDMDLALPPIAISESGYLEAPHKDKYGHDYAPAPDDHAGYPSDRK